MDDKLLAMLESKGITEDMINVLVEEDFVTKSTLALLQEEHLQKLYTTEKSQWTARCNHIPLATNCHRK